MKKLRHRVQISVAERNGERQKIIAGESKSIPRRIFRMLFGETDSVLLITPGRTVEGIEIRAVEREE